MSDKRPTVRITVNESNKTDIVDCVLKHTNPGVASINLKDEIENENTFDLVYDIDPSEEGKHIIERFISDVESMDITTTVVTQNL